MRGERPVAELIKGERRLGADGPSEDMAVRKHERTIYEDGGKSTRQIAVYSF